MAREPGDGPDRRDADYRTARIGAAGALAAVTVVILVLDALVPTYDVDPVVLGLLLGSIGGLLGVDALGLLRRSLR
jgi:hypothetical protein